MAHASQLTSRASHFLGSPCHPPSPDPLPTSSPLPSSPYPLVSSPLTICTAGIPGLKYPLPVHGWSGQCLGAAMVALSSSCRHPPRLTITSLLTTLAVFASLSEAPNGWWPECTFMGSVVHMFHWCWGDKCGPHPSNEGRGTRVGICELGWSYCCQMKSTSTDVGFKPHSHAQGYIRYICFLAW